MKRRYLVDAIVAVAAIVCGLTAFRAFRMGVPVNDAWLFPTVVLIPALLALGFGLSFLATPATRLNIVLLAASVSAGLYGVEAVLQVVQPARPLSREEVALKAGRPWDTRDKADVALDLRTKGITDAGMILPATALRASSDRGGANVHVGGRFIVPLANLANRTLVNCNESGTYAIFDSDEHGFNNPRGIWSEPIDVVIIGDSFVVGSCVDPGDNTVSLVRQHGVRVAGAAVVGFGPLSELGILKEYVAPVKPRDVLWFYYEWNDLHEMNGELRVPELAHYLEPDYSQGLLEKQAAIDAQLAAFIDRQLEAHAARPPRPATPQDESRSAREVLAEWVRLFRLRHTLGLAEISDRVGNCCDIDAFRKVLTEADRTVGTWGGRLHLVYLPAAVRYYSPPSAVINDAMRQRRRIIGIAQDLAIPVIDMDSAFHEHGDATAMYHDFRSHFSAEGYRVIAEAVVRHMK